MKGIVTFTGEPGNTIYVQVEHIVLWRYAYLDGSGTTIHMLSGGDFVVREHVNEVTKRIVEARVGL